MVVRTAVQSTLDRVEILLEVQRPSDAPWMPAEGEVV